MYKVMMSFVCRNCVNAVSSTGRDNSNLKIMDKFCYLGDMLSVDRDADTSVESRIRIGWNKLRQLVPSLTNKDIALIVRGKLYGMEVRRGQ